MGSDRDTGRATARAWAGVAAITASLFVFLTTELMPVGLLTPLGDSLGVSVGVAGLMVTLWGVAAGLGVPFIVAWTRRIDRRLLLVVLLGILTIGNLATAASPTFAMVLITRLSMGFASGVFWAIGVSMAMRIVPEDRSSRAAAVVMSGISIGTVLGIPLGALLEALTDWRATFAIWSALSSVVLLAVLMTVPALPSANTVSVREVFRLPVMNRSLRLVLFVVSLFVLGHFGAYTFVRPYLEGHGGATSAFITVALMVYGLGGAVGNYLGGRAVQRSRRGSFVAGCLGIAVSLLLLFATGSAAVGAVLSLALWGLSFGVVQLAQVDMTLAAAPDTFEAAMSLNTMAYNTSIALGALFGGLVADGLGVSGVIWFGLGLTVSALVVMAVFGSMVKTVRDGEGRYSDGSALSEAA